MNEILSNGYSGPLGQSKERIRTAQYKALPAAGAATE
ncbi:hypothetical protein BH24GEM3_BH24GEM3_21980 [soil metagenome]|jgi:hypothetical protein